jgi:hypothetical protein
MFRQARLICEAVMYERIETVNSTALQLRTRDGRLLLFLLDSNETIPTFFSNGDLVDVVSFPNHPTIAAMELENGGYFGGLYTITHVRSGVVLRTRHQDARRQLTSQWSERG